MNSRETVKSKIIALIADASYEDLRLFLIFIERYLRKRKAR